MNVVGAVIDGTALRSQSRELPAPTGSQVLVRIDVAGICGSDLKALHAAPTTLRREAGMFGGHEGAGTVLAVGPFVTSLNPGDEVLVYSYEGCQRCGACVAGEPKFCPEVKATSVGRDGTWASHMLIAAASCVRLPSGLDLLDAAVLACTGGTAAAAVLKSGPPPPGTPVLLLGAGPLGCAVAQLLTGLAAVVHAVEPNQARLEFAMRQGWVTQAAGDGEFPVVIETSGSEAGRAHAVRSAANAATVVFVGLGAAQTDLHIDAVIRRELNIAGSHFWKLGAFISITQLYRQAGVRPRDLVTGHYSLSDIEAACHDAVTATGKLVLKP